MDDLALLTEMGDRTPLPSAAELAPARDRLLSAIDAGRAPRRRFLRYGAAVVGLAAAITGVFAIGGFGVAPPKASAAEVLLDAAAYARSLPDTPPRPDQFVYIKFLNGVGGTHEIWQSADGTRDATYEGSAPAPGCRDGKKAVVFAGEVVPGEFEPCEPEPAYDPAMPTDAAGMRTYLADVHGADADNLNDLAKTIWWLLSSSYVPPQSLAAMFEVAAQTDGLTVVENVTDVAGRPGIGVSWEHEGRPSTIVFDAQTYQLLGTPDEMAMLAVGVVDEAGQRP